MKKNVINRYNLLNFIISGSIFLLLIFIYLLWSKEDSSSLSTSIAPATIRTLHYYSGFGLGIVLPHFLFDLLIFILIYPIIYIVRIVLSKKFKIIIDITLFYLVFFILLLMLNLIYCINGMKSIITESILGYVDYFLTSIFYEIYLPMLLFFVIEIFIFNKE